MPEEIETQEPAEVEEPAGSVETIENETDASEPKEPEQLTADSKESVKDAKSASPIPADVKAHIEELKSLNPAVAGKIRDAFWQAAAIKREFPGGINEARAFKQLAQELGGPDGAEGVKAQLAEIAELDRLWETKNPLAVQNIAEDYPEQFSALMPTALESWVKHDPQGFNRTACAMVANTLEARSIDGYSPLNLLWMAEQSLAMNNGEQTQKILSILQNWARGFTAAATEQPKPQTKSEEMEHIEKLQQQITNQQEQAFNSAVGNRVERLTEQKIKTELAPFLKGKQLTQGQRETLNAKVIEILAKRLQSDKDFSETIAKYGKSRDENGLVKFSMSKISTTLPGVVKESYRWLFGGQKTNKVGQATQLTAASATVKAGSKPWEKVSKMPSPNDVDLERSPFEMRVKSSAVLKSGRRVYWGAQPYPS